MGPRHRCDDDGALKPGDSRTEKTPCAGGVGGCAQGVSWYAVVLVLCGLGQIVIHLQAVCRA